MKVLIGDNDVDDQDSDGIPLLHTAVDETYNIDLKQNTIVLGLLHELGANINVRDFQRNTIVHLMARRNRGYNIRQFLAAYGKSYGDDIHEDICIDIDAQNYLAETPLMVAVDMLRQEAFDALFSAARHDLRDYRGRTVLHYFCSSREGGDDDKVFRDGIQVMGNESGFVNWLDKSGRTASDVGFMDGGSDHYGNGFCLTFRGGRFAKELRETKVPDRTIKNATCQSGHAMTRVYKSSEKYYAPSCNMCGEDIPDAKCYGYCYQCRFVACKDCCLK